MSIIDIIDTFAMIIVVGALVFFVWMAWKIYKKEMKKASTFQAPTSVKNYTQERKVEINIGSITVNHYDAEQTRLIANSEGEPLEKMLLLAQEYAKAEMSGKDGSKHLNSPVKEIIYNH
ncbi:MAG: hypothetical protein AAF738_07340 [Bacteroidota bacterium]